MQRIVRQYMLLQTTVAWIAKRGRIKASGPSVQLEGAVLEAWREYPYMDMWTEGLEKWASHDERDGAIADQKVFSLWRLIDRPKRQRGREERDFTKHRFIASFAGYEGVNDYADWRVEGADDADVVRREMVSAAAQEVSAEQPAPDADGWVKNRARIRLLRVGIEHLEGGVMDEESRARLARFRAELATREALADDGAQEGRGAGEVAAISRDEAARVASAP